MGMCSWYVFTTFLNTYFLPKTYCPMCSDMYSDYTSNTYLITYTSYFDNISLILITYLLFWKHIWKHVIIIENTNRYRTLQHIIEYSSVVCAKTSLVSNKPIDNPQKGSQSCGSGAPGGTAGFPKPRGPAAARRRAASKNRAGRSCSGD